MQKLLNRNQLRHTGHYVLAALFVLAPAGAARAVGFLLPNQDPEAIGRGDAFAATADDPAALYYNPAGITQLPGTQVSLGLYAISAYTSFSSPSGSAHTDGTPQLVPQIYATYSFTNVPVSVGLGVYAPYGLSINWGDATPFNTVAESGSLLYLAFNPNVAWRISSTLSVAGGISVNYSQSSFQSALPAPYPFGQFKFNGYDVEPSANFGILWQPLPKWSVGLDYHSETMMNYSGKVQQTSGFGTPDVYTSAKIRFPQYVTGGISFRPTPKWNLEFDLEWTEWSVLKQISFQNTPFGGPYPITLNYRDSFIYDFGVTRQLGKGYYASVGYIYSENSSPSANFNPLVPDAALNLGNFGFGHHGKYIDWAIAYQFAYNGGRNILGDDPNPGTQGTYKTFNNAVNASMTFKF